MERRKGRQGKDTVDAPPRHHEDVANSACGALVLAGLARPADPDFIHMCLTVGAGEKNPFWQDMRRDRDTADLDD